MTPEAQQELTTQVSLIRHGLVHNPNQLYYGRLPGFGLAEVGRIQAAGGGQALARQSIAAVYHSPMQRAAETAAIIAAQFEADIPVIECDLLSEIHSPYDGTSITEMEQRDWDFYRDLSPAFEHPRDILARMLRFLENARDKHAGQHVVGVSHGDPIAFAVLWACGHWATFSHQNYRRLLLQCGVTDGYPAPASITTLNFSGNVQGDGREIRYRVPAE